jgi:GrpB-like predicted nucleotidyltransferase (UPF0157 family)
MSIILTKTDDLFPQVERILHRVFARIGALLPDAELHHIGATALPGALTKGDIDFLLRVTPARFPTAVGALKQHFEVRQPDNWTPEFASFGDDASYDLPIGVQVVVKDSSVDFLLFLRDYFTTNADALSEYNRLKVTHCGSGQEGYWKAKDQFLAKILASRKR